jgi:hypothetical protein
MNFEANIQSILEKYIVYMYNEYILEFGQLDDNKPDFDFDFVTSIREPYYNNDKLYFNNFDKLYELFMEYFNEETGKELIYNNYKAFLESEYDNNEELIEELLTELTYNIEDYYDYFNINIFINFKDYIELIIDNLTTTILK